MNHLIISNPSSYKILIVDDNPINRKLTGKFLDQWGFRSDEAPNALDAFEMLSDKSYNLILMDIEMPELDGLEASRFIRNISHAYFKEIPIIAFSAHKEHEMKSDVSSAGVNDYIEKPFLPEILKNKLYTLLKLPS